MKNKSIIFTVLISLLLIPGYSSVSASDDSSTCLECHDDMPATLAGSPHELGISSHLKSPVKATCEGCHTDWEGHIDDPTTENINTASKLMSAEQAEICGSCHLTPHQAAMTSTDPHARADLGCLSCHKIHDNENSFLTKDDSENYCLSCHKSVAFEFERRSAHPLGSGNIRCVDCHNLSAINDPVLGIGFDWTCQECHSEKSGPFMYEHPVVNSHLVEGGGCIECHEPHGSSNERLLVQPESGLCLQCHGTPPLHMTQHDAIATKYACAACHTEIHGSYESRVFLDPNLPSKFISDCYQSGCHNPFD
ncbi:MAG: hypothetical protein GY839_12700 [candidate division Zixibacteria bacterium]|nr:hypothetical protein [candidate division Zixibacteria bacterium]